MDYIKKRQVNAYILLESLITMALLGVITLVVLREISANRLLLYQQNKEIEELNVALMAYDSEQTNLNANGVIIHLTKTDKLLTIANDSGEVLRLEMLQEKP
ncbi:MAG: hypothetical protein L0I48_01815 [Lactococcus plantarum]|nr:hypothetical protein [Lactococcus plantarum]MDN6069909.1 hypothetical protein [Lactococcus plantarum]MDN6083908.1 hypothetical protein [Lactococcus plantarum]